MSSGKQQMVDRIHSLEGEIDMLRVEIEHLRRVAVAANRLASALRRGHASLNEIRVFVAEMQSQLDFCIEQNVAVWRAD